MPNKNANRGKNLERALVKRFLINGITAKRAWGSNGEALGLHRTVDLLVNNSIKFQVKKKKVLPEWLGFTEYVDGVIVQTDRQEPIVMIQLKDYLTLLGVRHE